MKQVLNKSCDLYLFLFSFFFKGRPRRRTKPDEGTWAACPQGKSDAAVPHLYSTHLISPYPSSPFFSSPHLIFLESVLPHFISSYLTLPYLTSPYLFSPYLSSPHLISLYLTQPHFNSPHLSASFCSSSYFYWFFSCTKSFFIGVIFSWSPINYLGWHINLCCIHITKKKM